MNNYRSQFDLPEHEIYLSGHSLGPLLKNIFPEVEKIIKKEWKEKGVKGWHECDWLDLPQLAGKKIAELIGANANEVIVTDSTSVNLFKLLIAGLQLQRGRHVILTDSSNFPADLYIAQGLLKFIPNIEIRYCAVADLEKEMSNNIAIVMITQVNYLTSELYDMKKITEIAHAQGALALFDLSHSVGIMPLDLNACQVDLAVGCTYKYLNGGPGSPAFLYVATRYHEQINSPIQGWMGHAAPFAFEKKYHPAASVSRFLGGTPSVLSLRILMASLSLIENNMMKEIRHASQLLSELLINLLRMHQSSFELASPVNPNSRGGHVAYQHENAATITAALLARGVICDFRQPNIMRFGMNPLYLREEDIDRAAKIIREIKS